MTENELSKIVIGIGIKIHSSLGPGLLESVYEAVICYELTKLDIPFTRQEGIKIQYEDVILDIGFRSDIVVDNKLMIELKSIEDVHLVHKKILLTYLRLTGIKLGLLINFKVNLLKEGIFRLANDL